VIIILIVITTPNPCGTPTSIGNSSSVYSATTGINTYTCYYFSWVASNNGSVTLAFQFRNNPSLWLLDDISVSDGTNEMLSDGGFESGTLSPNWIVSTPNGACGGGATGAKIRSTSCRTGTYCLSDGCLNVADQVSQSFSVIVGNPYSISFWLKQGGTGSGIYVSVTIF